MGSLVVPVVHEVFVGWKHAALIFAGFMESFDLAYG
jgi:hypothetical protein